MAFCWTAKTVEQAQELRESGRSWGDIGTIIGATGGAVRTKLFTHRKRFGDVESKRALRQDNARQLETISRLLDDLKASRKPRVKLDPEKIRPVKGEFNRMIVNDVHGCFMDEAATSACLADVRRISPAEIVVNGDLIDCGGFLAEHHTWGYVAEADYSYADDVQAANLFLDKLQEAAPNARIHFLEGNHERRVETWCLTKTLRSKRDAQMLLDHIAVENVLNLAARGIAYYKQGRFYQGLGKPNTIKLGKCFFTHGDRHGTDVAMKTLKDFGYNVCFAHTHSPTEASTRTVQHGVIGSWNPGSLCRLQPLWRHGQITSWAHGYGVQTVLRSGAFQHINVKIVDGQSFMFNLLG